jgi:hypothetical protein
MGLPLCFCPPGVARPAWTRNEPTALLGNKGTCYHGGYREGDWKTSAKKWQVLLEGHKPQHLVRADQHPRIVTMVAVRGAEQDHAWAMPVLIRPILRTKTVELYEPAVDRVLRGGELAMPTDLADLVHELLSWAAGAPPADPAEDGDRRLVRIACQGAALTHHVDLDLIDLAGWLTVAAAVRMVRGMCGLPPESDPVPEAPAPC